MDYLVIKYGNTLHSLGSEVSVVVGFACAFVDNFQLRFATLNCMFVTQGIVNQR